MKIDFSVLLVGLSGEPLNEGKLTLAGAALNGLLSQTPSNAGLVPGAELARAYSLATRIYEAKEPIEVTVEELSLLKEKIAAAYQSPLVVGPAWKLLDG